MYRLRSAGYDAPPECELCGATHGHWVCQHADLVAAFERSQCPHALIRGARASDPTTPTTSLPLAVGSRTQAIGHPLLSTTEHVVQLASPDGTLHEVPLDQ